MHHTAFNPFVRRFETIDKLVAGNKAILLCKKELRLVRVVMNSRNWPGSDMVRKNTKPSTVHTKTWFEEKQRFFGDHELKIKDKLRSFETIEGIMARRHLATIVVS